MLEAGEVWVIFMGKFNLTEKRKKYLMAVIVVFAVYFAMKYISPIMSPFIFAFLVAGTLNPLVQKLHKKIKVKKSILTALLLLIACGFIFILVWMLFSSLITGGSRLAAQMPYYQEELCILLGDCCDLMEKKFGVDGVQIENFVLEQVNVLVENLEVNVLPEVMGKSVGYMKSIVSFGSFIVIMIIAVLLIMKDFDKYMEKVKAEDELKGVREVVGKVIIYVKTFIKTQVIILCIISAVCAITLSLLGMKGGVFYGILTGFMDMLPFIGTGIMLIPLAFFMLINGNGWQAFLCFGLYGVCALIREFLEPKLIGERIGVWPVGILFAVFAGLRLFGVWGIIKGPLSLVIVCEICKYLWRQQEGK